MKFIYSTKYAIFLIMLLGMMGMAEGACTPVVPVNGMTITTTENCTFIEGEYDITDNLIISENNVVLNGNNAKLTGDQGDWAILASGRSGITIANLTIENMDIGILLSNVDNSIIEDCTLKDNEATSGKTGLTLTSGSDGNIIRNNIFLRNYDSLLIGSNCNNNRIEYNEFNDSIYSGVKFSETNAENNNVTHNTFHNMTWNSVDINTNNTLVAYNNFTDCRHHCIDLYDTEGTIGQQFQHNTISNNIINFSITGTYNGIYVQNSSNNTIVNNTIDNVPNIGIVISGGDLTTQNNITENTVSNSAVADISTSGQLNIFKDNTISTPFRLSSFSGVYTNDTFKITGTQVFHYEFNITSTNVSMEWEGDWDSTYYKPNVGENWIYNFCPVDGVLPVDDASYSSDTRLCKGAYYIYNTGSNGALIIGGNDVELDCNGAKLIGNTSGYGIWNNYGTRTGVTIKNCEISNYANNIRFYKVHDSIFENLILHNSSSSLSIIQTCYDDIFRNITYIDASGVDQRGIYVDTSRNLTIANNTFINIYDPVNLLTTNNSIVESNNFSRSTGGVRLRTAYNNTVTNNYFFDQLDRGVYLTDRCIDNNITYNTFQNISTSGNSAIHILNSNKTKVNYNYINGSGHNGIDIDGHFNDIEHNNITNIDHNGIDLLKSPVGTLVSGYNNIRYNRIYKSISTTESSGILLTNTINNNVSYNYIYDIYGTGGYETGINSGGNQSNNGNNYILNNTIINTTYCLWSEVNTTFENNSLSGCTYSILIKDYNNVISTDFSYVNMVGNVFENAYYISESQTKSITVNDTSTLAEFELPNNEVYNFPYNGVKDFNISNNSITLYSDTDSATYTIESGQTLWALQEDPQTCTFPIDDEVYTVSTTMCKGYYFLPSGIEAGCDDCIIDGNGCTLDDSDRGTDAGLFMHGEDDIIVKNFIFRNYEDGIKIWAGRNATLVNNTFYNCGGQCVDLAQSANYKVNIENNTAYCNGSSDAFAYSISKSNQTTLKNNYGYNCNVGAWVQGTNATIVEDNYFYNMSRQGIAFTESDTDYYPKDVIARNNIINKTDVGILCQNCYNLSATGNTLVDITGNYDAYITGIYAFADNTLNRSEYIYLANNTIEYGQIGIWVQKSRNVTILDTTCNQIALSDITSRVADVRTWTRAGIGNPLHYFEPTKCIYLGEQYKGWIGDSTESIDDNYTKFKKYNVTDVYVSGITYNDNVQTFLHTQGVYGNIEFNLPTNWNRSFWLPTNMTDYDRFYNNPSWHKLCIVPSTTSGIQCNFIKSRAGQYSANFDEVNYSLSQNVFHYENINSGHVFSLEIDKVEPHNGLFNGTVATNQTIVLGCPTCAATYTQYLPSGIVGHLLSYESASSPKPTQIATTVTDVDYVYDSTSQTLLFNTSGSGSSTLAGLGSLGNPTGYYSVFKDGVEESTIYADDTYTMSEVASWFFQPALYSSQQCNAMKNTFEKNFYPIFGVMGLFVFVIMVALVYRKTDNGNADTTYFYKLLGSVCLLMLLLVAVATVVLNILVSIC